MKATKEMVDAGTLAILYGYVGFPTREEAERIAQNVINAALALLQSSAPEWKTIETAPKDGTRVLLGNSAKVAYGYWGTFSHTGAQWVTVEPTQWISPSFAQPTHWMPLPAPPGSLASRPAASPELIAQLEAALNLEGADYEKALLALPFAEIVVALKGGR